MEFEQKNGMLLYCYYPLSQELILFLEDLGACNVTAKDLNNHARLPEGHDGRNMIRFCVMHTFLVTI
jgi:hypothetical protein